VYIDQPLTKLYYTIGEVADLMKVNASLIRFWEKEFPNIKPKKSKSGIRKYTVKDIEKLTTLYNLIKEEGHTLDGARRILKEGTADGSTNLVKESIKKLENLEVRLMKLKADMQG
jgi:DNA-binding transcriptional MerR regulator